MRVVSTQFRAKSSAMRQKAEVFAFEHDFEKRSTTDPYARAKNRTRYLWVLTPGGRDHWIIAVSPAIPPEADMGGWDFPP